MSQSSINNSEPPERSQKSTESESENSIAREIRSVEGSNNQVVQADGSSVNQINLNNSNNNSIVLINDLKGDLSSLINQQADIKNIHNSQIEHGRELILKGQFNLALDYFLRLKKELWDTAEYKIKYRILANIGLANYELENSKDSAKYFINALRFRASDNDQSLALAGLGYELVDDYDRAKDLAKQALQLNPGNSIANGLIIRINADNYTLEELTNLVDSPYRDDVNVLAALGNAALDKDKLTESEEYFKRALEVAEGNTKRLKLALSSALLKPFTNNVPLFLIGQFDREKQKKIEQAVELLTDILDKTIPNPDLISKIQLDAIINRSGAYWLLDKRDEPIRDIEIALQTKLENSQMIRQYADLLYRSGSIEKAISELREIAAELQNPEAALDLANILVDRNSFHEAEELLDQIIEQDLDSKRKSKAQQTKISLYIKSGKLQEAKLLCEQIIEGEPNNIINLVQYIYILNSANEKDPQIGNIINRYRESLDIDSLDVISLYSLARLYADFKYFRDAASIYEKLADTTLDNELTGRLLYAYFYSGNLKSALTLCEQIMARSGKNLSIAKMTSYIYEYVGDLDKARQVCQSILKYFPDNISIQLRLAVINRRTYNFEDLDSFLDSDINLDDLTLNDCKELIRLYKLRNKLQCAAEILYKTRRNFYQDSWVHVYYFSSYIKGISSVSGEFNFLSVINNCGVLLKDQFDSENWYIIDDMPDSESNRNEISSQHPLYKKLLGKKAGDEIIVRKGFQGKGKITKTIVAITDKYFAAKEHSARIIEESDDLEDFMSFKITNVDEINEQSEIFILYSQTIQNNESHFKELYSYYSLGKLTFGGLAKVANNQNPIDLWLNLAFKKDYSIFCYRNPRENYKSSFSYLEKGGLIIIDIISLLTLYHLGIADEAVKALGKFGISQSTFDLFNLLIHKLQEQTCNEYIHIDISMGFPIFDGHFPDEPAQLKAHFEQIVEWIKINCCILTSDKALDLNQQSKDERNEAIGTSFVDTVLLASEPNCILLSEDQSVRNLAYLESGTKGVWSQIVLSYCYAHNHIDLSKYFDAYLYLINWGYEFLFMDTNLLIEGAKRADWKSQKPYTTLLEHLGNSQATEDYFTSVATDFIYKLYTEDILPHYRDTLIFELLKSITNKKSQNNILRQLIPKIKQKFYLLSANYDEILSLIAIWRDFYTVKT